MTTSDSNTTDLIDRIKAVMAEELMLQDGVDDIADDAPLFDPSGVGLDSVDALQLVVGLEKEFGLKIPDTESAKDILKSVNSIAEAIRTTE